MSVLIIDYGMGNLGSIRRSLEECGAKVLLSDDPRSLRSAVCAVLPGVGAFADGMKNLEEKGWIPAIREEVVAKGIPLLGICLGMQLLAGVGNEGGKRAGLGLIAGEARRLEPEEPGVRIPHVGWNEVHAVRPSPLFEGIPEGTDFYFVHGYHLVPADAGHLLATTPYCGGFASAVASGSVYGVQFHPEKSGRSGFGLLRNFLMISGAGG